MRSAPILKAVSARAYGSKYSDVIYDNLIAYLKEYGIKDPETMMAASPTLTNQLVDNTFEHISTHQMTFKNFSFKLQTQPIDEGKEQVGEMIKFQDYTKHSPIPEYALPGLYLSAIAEVMRKVENKGIIDVEAVFSAKTDALTLTMAHYQNPDILAKQLQETYVNNDEAFYGLKRNKATPTKAHKPASTLSLFNINKLIKNLDSRDLSNLGNSKRDILLLENLKIYAFANQLDAKDLATQFTFSQATLQTLDIELQALEREITQLSNTGVNRDTLAQQLEIMQTAYDKLDLDRNSKTIQIVKESELRSNLLQTFDAKDVDIFIKTMKSVNYHKLTFSEKMSQDGFATAILETIKHWVESLGTPEAGSQYKKFGEHLAKVMNKEKEAAKNNGRHS